MFNKITNLDLLNKINILENKVDMILCHINTNTLSGCCDCKKKECHIYNELKLYIEEKNDILKEEVIKGFDNTTVFLNKFNDVFNNYKNDLITCLDTIINQISKENDVSTDDTNVPQLNTLYGLILSLNSKIDNIFYENEIIKHQFLLEDDIRKYSDEIDNLNKEVNNMLENINCILDLSQ